MGGFLPHVRTRLSGQGSPAAVVRLIAMRRARIAAVVLLRGVAWIVPPAAAFVIVTALVASLIEDAWWRLGAGAVACVALPLVLRRVALHKLRVPETLAAVNLVTATILAFGFADDVGRALRRHGDWFVGERHGAVARAVRFGISSAADY